MRVIKADTDFLFYQKIFKQLMADESTVVVWQISPETGQRNIADTKINALHFESGKIFFDLSSSELKGHLPLYCYAEAGPIIFKTDIQDILDNNLGVAIPEEIKMLEDPEVTHILGSIGRDMSDVWKVKRLSDEKDEIPSDVMKVKSMAERSSRDQELLNNEFDPPLNLDEEDKIFADKRESPRARPKIDKFVKVAKIWGSGPEIYKLFDLSRGGMGFIIFDETGFAKGEDIHIVGFNEFDLDDPLVGRIMSIRPIDGAESEFKVGVKFSEGQD
jgi:hypothetical protein